jgi:hypothetical protein
MLHRKLPHISQTMSPQDAKSTWEDDLLPDGTLLKAGSSITYLPYAMGRMPFLWGEDALQFKPERWLWQDDEGRLCVRPESPFKFPVFQVCNQTVPQFLYLLLIDRRCTFF